MACGGPFGCAQGMLARMPVAPLTWVVDYYVIAVALCWKISVDYSRLEPAGRYHILFQLLLNRTVLFLYQPGVIFLRRRLELPLVFEEGGVVDVLEKLAQVVIFHHAHAPERRLGNIRRIGYYCAAL